MNVFTRIVMQLGEDDEYHLIEADSYEYEGPVARCDPTAIALTVLGGAASAVVGNALSGKSKTPTPPAAPPVLAMPDPGATAEAKKRQRAAKLFEGQMTAQSTLLGSEDKLGA